jgi:hypothetical protein
MGTLRLRHCELLDACGRLLTEKKQTFASADGKCVSTFIRTCAAVNYSPPTLPMLIHNQLIVDDKSIGETNRSIEMKNRIDLIWSLTILDRANENHWNSVLNQETFQAIQSKMIIYFLFV